MNDKIIIKGAKENNLKNIDVEIPRDKLVVFTGLSGSGKSTLAFDTIFAEGQRRYVESLSAYARQFLGQYQKPNVESIEGLSPAISIDQKTTSHNPRSTVGTVTEIYDYLRLLYARVGDVYCPNCGEKISCQTVDQISDKVMAFGEKSKIMVMSPIARGKKGTFQKELANLRKSGYARVKIDGIAYSLDEDIVLEKNIRHTIFVIIDRLIIKNEIQKRLNDSLETAIKLSKGIVVIDNEGEEYVFSTKYSCSNCGTNIEEIEPRIFSFNTPWGACSKCSGLGYISKISEDLIVPDDNLSLNQNAIRVGGWNFDTGSFSKLYLEAVSKMYGFSMDTPFKDLSRKEKDIIFYGNNGEKFDLKYNAARFKGSIRTSYEGVISNLERRYKETASDGVKSQIERYMRTTPCDECKGARLKKEALSVYIGGKNIMQLSDMPIIELKKFVKELSLSKTKVQIAESILKEINARLQFLIDVGLSYLTLSRSAGTLSGGEAQRIRLATQIGSGLTGVLYILDEPSIGLHQRDNSKLIGTLKHLRDLGNSLIVVEHDEETIETADYIVDIGPRAGTQGGEVVVSGTLEDVKACEHSITGEYLSKKKKIEVPKIRRKINDKFLEIKGAKQNNLKNINVKIPLGVFTCITGVSGSGKSSLINETLYPYLARNLMRANTRQGDFKEITGLEYIDKVIQIDQSPIGRSPRSNPATYTGVFTPIRELFAATKEAKERGYKSGRFSFNVKGGRCENCQGDGIIKIEMHFLPDIYVPCEVCHGKRYNRETLSVKYKGKTISNVLNMRVDEACEFFKNQPSIYKKIKTLQEVGLGYIKLGQSATTLSGGEAQRVKLATYLSKRSTGKTVFILDEPTTGLHMDDVKKLIEVLQRLCEGGNTVIVIEHNLDVIKVSDYIIDLGPEGGTSGGKVIAKGTPEKISKSKVSYTGKYLEKVLTKEKNNGRKKK